VSRRGLAALCALAALVGCRHAEPAFPDGRVVDLTHDFAADTIFWPSEKGFELERGFEGETAGGWWYAAHRFRSAEHGGTHVDAPVHFAREGASVDALPLERLLGPALRIDAREACARDRDHRIATAELLAWEDEHGPIPAGSIVLLHTGFAARWPDREAYLGTAERGAEAVAHLHFPGLHPRAAAWLVSERRVAAVGIDTASIDHGPSREFESHRVLAAAGVPAFENLANLEQLPARGFAVVALPMKIRGGSGAPLRVAAIVPERGSRW
jgi:kynurenine formamidase